jgi:DNA polymerase-3 subunit epsilon
MSFATIRKAGFDTETTGSNPDEARIVTAALVVRGGDRPDQDFTWLINPGVPIPEETTEIHGISTEIAQAKGQDPKIALEDIASKLAAALKARMPVIAFNLSYDWTVLDRDLRRHGLATMAERYDGIAAVTLLDPHVIDKQVIPRRKGSGMRKLKPTSEVYEIQLEDWHTAEADALAALRITEAQFERYPQLAQMTPAQLFAAQKQWSREQAESLQAFFRTKPDKANEIVDGSWPLRPFPTAVAASGPALPHQ